MNSFHPDMIKNKLIGMLPQADMERLAGDLEHVELPRATPLASAGQPVEHVHFLTRGIASVVPLTPEGHRAEAGLFGFEGNVITAGIPELEISTHSVAIQLQGEGYRMPYASYRGWMATNRTFSRIMIRSMEAFAVQLAYTAVSNAIHGVDERLARWLLMCHDRVEGNEIPLTHDFIAVMLAVRRPSVTTTLHVLEGNGFIKGERGNIVIRNRAGLEEFAHDAYGRPEAEYKRMMKDVF